MPGREGLPSPGPARGSSTPPRTGGDEPAVHGADEALFRPIRGGNAFEETVERLLSTLRLGVVAPGGRRPPGRELAAPRGVRRARPKPLRPGR